MLVRRSLDLDTLAAQLAGDYVLEGVDTWASRTRALGRALSLLENDPWLATRFLQHPKLCKLRTHARVIGLTGLPGAGKSSLTSHIVSVLRKRNNSVAVLAVDPSSVENGGAVLGDRIRMQEHFCDPLVYIRSMGSRGALGGVSRATRGAIRLIGLLGYDYIVVETVGIGQSESEIVSIADTTALVLMPNSGDDIQLMKAGVLQLADIYVVNKCDLGGSERLLSELRHNNSEGSRKSGWMPSVLGTSAISATGISELVDEFERHAIYESAHPDGRAEKRQRIRTEITNNVMFLLEREVLSLVGHISECELDEVQEGLKPAMVAANRIFSQHFAISPPNE